MEEFGCIDCGIYGVHCGYEACKPGHFFGPYVRDHYLVHYVEKGKGIFEVNNKRYNVGEGDIFFIAPHVLTYYEADAEQPWTYKWIGIRARDAEQVFERAGISVKNPVMSVGKNVSASIDRLLAAAQSEKGKEIAFTACAYGFFSELIKSAGGEPLREESRCMYAERAAEYIRRYVYKWVTVSEVAAYVNVDRSYLSCIFKKHIGIPPQQYIINIKMKTACEYLESTEYDIGRIAQSVGYDDLFVFSHAFKKVMKVSPKKYRETHKKF